MFGILGGGFGLYGHLPAIAHAFDDAIVLPLRFQSTFLARLELHAVASRVVWAKDERETLARSHTATLALTPVGQEQWLAACADSPNIRQLVLEKPLATSPSTASHLLRRLIDSNKPFRVNYTFLYTPWFAWLASRITRASATDHLSVRWTFHAHHFRHALPNWKRAPELGGGALRFYGIHLVAALAALGSCEVLRSTTFGATSEDAASWTAELLVSGVRFSIAVNSACSETLFAVRGVTQGSEAAEEGIRLLDPFAEFQAKDGYDPRVLVLQGLYKSLAVRSEDASHIRLCLAVQQLWQAIEAKTRHVLQAL
jgi:hypothetical protein